MWREYMTEEVGHSVSLLYTVHNETRMYGKGADPQRDTITTRLDQQQETAPQKSHTGDRQLSPVSTSHGSYTLFVLPGQTMAWMPTLGVGKQDEFHGLHPLQPLLLSQPPHREVGLEKLHFHDQRWADPLLLRVHRSTVLVQLLIRITQRNQHVCIFFCLLGREVGVHPLEFVTFPF